MSSTQIHIDSVTRARINKFRAHGMTYDLFLNILLDSYEKKRDTISQMVRGMK